MTRVGAETEHIGTRQRGRPVTAHIPFAMVGVVALAGLLRIVQYHWREGAVLLGGALLLAAVFRVVLPAGQAGLIAIRGRWVDVLLYGSLGAVVLLDALTITGGPFT